MTLPPESICDKGRRYEIHCKDNDGKDVVVGWSDSSEAFQAAINMHPGLHSRYVVDRKEIRMETEHISLTHSFQCPHCGGLQFRSYTSDGNRKYSCSSHQHRDYSELSWCGWSGPAEECFTIPRVKDNGSEVIKQLKDCEDTLESIWNWLHGIDAIDPTEEIERVLPRLKSKDENEQLEKESVMHCPGCGKPSGIDPCYLCYVDLCNECQKGYGDV